MNNKKTDKSSDLNKRLAKLEFINDQLVTEIAYIDKLMRQVGFTDGLESLKLTAQELYENGIDEDEDKEAA